jgi:hypothetical protein
MRFTSSIATLALVAAATTLPLRAQEHEHEHEAEAGQASDIPSLSEQDIPNLKTGAGMGFAKPAELNHYPGPKHVLEHAEDLSLTDEQRDAVGAIRNSMLEKAIPLGEKIIEAESMLGRRFEHGHIDAEALAEMTSEVAALYGKLRYTHLAAHLATKELLTEEQIETYDRLRGYTSE